MSNRFPQLKGNAQRGSKPRCHLLTAGPPDLVAKRLGGLASDFVTVSPDDAWMPKGFDQVDEATLPEAGPLLDTEIRQALKDWWLASPSRGARTPSWDIAATCQITGKLGLLLVEAKAHNSELTHAETGKSPLDTPVSYAARRNLQRIDWCMRDSSLALAADTGLTWALSRDWNYQMSNRFAWSWKLTELGVPVVLVYLGFIKATDMSKPGEMPFPDAGAWEALVRAHSAPLFPDEVWNRSWTVNGVPFVPLIRSLEIPLEAPAP